MLRTVSLLIALALSVSFAAASDEKISPWTQEQLTETFMRSLSKHNCMAKTVSSLKSGCATEQCLKTLAGITGDCTTWASGNQAEFCASYTHKYISRYCASNELNARQCILLHVAKPTGCTSDSQSADTKSASPIDR